MNDDRPSVLVIAQSARALASAATRAGLRPLAVDVFADDDTAALGPVERVAGGFRCGFTRRNLLPAVDRLLARTGATPTALVLGSGFEDRPRLIARLAERWPLAGCGAAAVKAVKAPEGFAAACADLGIPHPPIARAVPGEGAFLVKRRAGTGGVHVRPAAPGPVPAGHYAQARVPGTPTSALVLADGRGGRVLAYSRQWADPSPDAPFRFAGVVGPVAPPPADAAIRAAADALARRFGLVGLVSLDMLVDGADWWALEINPRPGASLDALDVFDKPLMAMHIAACRGEAVPSLTADATIRATLVTYATADIRVPSAPEWPSHVLDRPAAGSTVSAGWPIATVVAEAADETAARRLAGERAAALKQSLGESER